MEKSFKEQVKTLDTTSKAGQLARELNAERNRLKQELEEAQVQVEDLTPVTPEVVLPLVSIASNKPCVPISLPVPAPAVPLI